MAIKHNVRLLRSAFAATVVYVRKQKGLSQEKLALEAEISRSYMSGLERAIHTPGLETIAKLLPLLGITWIEFFREFESKLAREARPDPSLSKKRRSQLGGRSPTVTEAADNAP